MGKQHRKSAGRPRRSRTIRSRLVRILLLPLVAVVVLLAAVVVDNTNTYQTANRSDQAVQLLLEADKLVYDLQQERGVEAGLLGGDASFQDELGAARSAVDIERTRLTELAVGVDAAPVRAALVQFNGLSDERAKEDAVKPISTSNAFDWYSARIAELTNINLGVDSSPDEALRRGVTTLQVLDDFTEYASQERAFLNGVFASEHFVMSGTTNEYSRFALIDANEQEALARYRQYATPEQMALVTTALDTGAGREAMFFRGRALAAAVPTRTNDRPFIFTPPVDSQSWWSANTTLLQDLEATQLSVGADVSARAASLKHDATVRLTGLGVLGLLCVVGAIILMVAATRSITRPLAVLATEARAIAEVRLPEAVRQAQTASPELAPDPPPAITIPRQSSTEVLAVADALDQAQATAYNLATEQARLLRSTSESMGNLGRRNQNLLRRQLGFITLLEREETDPTGLANLFELDHLATRMRRNAESLLVLVGESRPRTWSEPVPVSDVLRAAISEVEDYRRVILRHLDDAYVSGAFVAGVAHVIAELVENGLTFSPPDSDVEIQGRLVQGRYLIGITDEGIGMDKAEMDRANARVRGEESFLTAPTRYLGHYVVGKLAQQMNIGVEISSSPVTGVTARVTLPQPVLAASPAGLGTSPGQLAIKSAASEQIDSPTQVMETIPPANSPVYWFEQHDQLQPEPTGPAPVLARSTTVIRNSTVQENVVLDVAHGHGERTRNGLLKRVPSPRRPTAPAEASHTQPVSMEPDTTSSPRVRDTLNSLRSAMARGANDYAASNTSNTDPETDRSARVH